MRLQAWLKGFAADLNQPAFKAVVFAALTLTTALLYYICVFFAITIQEATWGLWLGFLAAGWGVTAWDYSTKRNTTFERHVRTPIAAEAAAEQGEQPPPGKGGG
jgi:hypothetical protein